jgi:hypothetical protein
MNSYRNCQIIKLVAHQCCNLFGPDYQQCNIISGVIAEVQEKKISERVDRGKKENRKARET